MTTASSFLNINIRGITERQRMIAGMAERLRDLSPVFEFAHQAFVREEREQFATEGVHINGVKWEPLSPAYAKRKPQPPPPYGILYRTGRLLASLTEDMHPDHIKIITPTSAAFGTRVPYGKYHRDGTENMPARSFVGARDAYRKLLHQAVVAHALGATLPIKEAAAAQQIQLDQVAA